MTEQIDLLSWTGPKGFLPNPEKDKKRLGEQLQRVLDALRTGKKFTLETLGEEARCPPASASARFRDLKHLGHAVRKEHIRDGLWLYWLDLTPTEGG